MSERQGRPEPSHSLYDILQVAPSATEDEIRRAYRRLALRYHPDKNPGDQAASAERFKAVQRAYRVLGDPRRRQLYDLYGSASLAEGFPDGQLWVLTSGWARCLLVAIFLATCCCCGCFCCCYCCCYFCCGLMRPPPVPQYSDLDAVVTSQPVAASSGRELTEYSSLLGARRFTYNAYQPQGAT
ncbi:dnaJ homolog subfamily C member 5-like [Schistocerca piceifrons]|uniref:dnaJ homolog subfamily C member 5-like n=1 Tax=Schistocerca piceifrons TaxID=274613 RepID=UPI001F5F9D02|nr:dnaJ homolog subfamily C member 5-like [Schistocerca piceifrons]